MKSVITPRLGAAVVALLCCLAARIVVVRAGVLKGRVAAVRGNDVTIALDSDGSPVPGDPVQFTTSGGFPSMGEVVSANQGEVTARLDEGSEGVTVGTEALISSSAEGLSQAATEMGGSSGQGLPHDMGREPWSPSETGVAQKEGPFGPKRPPPTRPAEAGRYETTTEAIARSGPSPSAPVLDRLAPGTILNVTGSEGDWLVVYSKKRNMTAYVSRDAAMLSVRQRQSGGPSDERRWQDIADRIRISILKWGVLNVDVTFIGDTAYLKGTVETERDRERAELAARSFIEVQYVTNWIRVAP